MEYVIFCYNILDADEEKIRRSFWMKARVRLIHVHSVDDLREKYIENVSGQVFLAFSGHKVELILPVLREIAETFPDLPVICLGEGLRPEEVALVRKTGTVNYLEREHLSSLYEVVRGILDKRYGKEITEKQIFRQYEFLLDVSDSYLSMISRSYTYLAINDAFCKAHDLERDELIGNTPVKLWGEQTFNKVIKPYLDKCFSKKEIHYRAWFDVPGKGKRFFEVLFRPHVNEQDEVDYVVVSSRDITNEEKAREQLKEYNEDISLINDLYRMSNEGVSWERLAEIAIRKIYDYFHAVTCNFYFFDEPKKTLKPVRIPLTESMYEKLRKAAGIDPDKISFGFKEKSFIFDILKQSKTVRFTDESTIQEFFYEFTGRSGLAEKFFRGIQDKFPIKAILIVPVVILSESFGAFCISSLTPFSNYETSRLTRLANQISLVLQHVREEKLSMEQSVKMRLFFETVADAIFIMDKDTFIDCNPTALKMFGLKKKDIIGKTPLDLSPAFQPEGKPSAGMAEKYINRVLQGRSQAFEWLHRDASGREFFTQVKLNRLILNGQYFIQAIVRDIDSEKRNRARLEESERSLREAQRIAHLGDWSWDISTGKVRWSEEFIRILGLDPDTDKPSLRLFARYVYPEDRKRVLHKIIHATKECEKCTDQFRLLLPDGTLKHIRSFGLLEKKKGKPNLWHGVIQDITDLKKAEEKILQQTSELNLLNRMNLELNKGKPLREIIKMLNISLRKIFPIQNIIIFLKDFPGENSGLKLISQTFSERKIKALERTVGDLRDFLLFTEKNSRFLHKVVRTGLPLLITDQDDLITGVEEYFEKAGLKLDGKALAKHFDFRSIIYYPVMQEKQLMGTILLFSSQRLTKNILTEISRVMDQTSMIILKKLNEDENQRLYTAIEHMNEILIISDKTGRILYVNEALGKLMGMKHSDLIGKNTRELRNPEENVSVYENIWQTVQKGEIWTGVLKLKNASGENIPTHYHITPIPDEKGEVVYFVTVIRDISQEMALERYMQRSQKLEMIGRFAGGLAHDFNNILATMLGYTDMVLEDADKKSKYYKYLQKIKTSGLKAQEIIQQLLTFNRGIEPVKEKTDPLRIIRESMDLLGTQIPRNIKVEIRKTGDIPSILADQVQLRQVFLNLVNNAVHALETKGNDGLILIELKVIKTDVKLRQKIPDIVPGRYLQILVRDNGTGMEKEVLDKIFEPFYTTKPVGKGSGMGLSVVHGIIKNHGGNIYVESVHGKGSSFWIYLPIS